MDEEREEREDQQEEQGDTEGHSYRFGLEDESEAEDDEGEEEEEGRYLSDARLEESVEPVAEAIERLLAL